MKSLALQPWTRFSLQWRLPSTNQLCAAEKPQNIFGPLYCADNVSEAKAFRAPHLLLLTYQLPRRFLQPFCFLQQRKLLLLICLGGYLTTRCRRGLIESNQDY